MRLLSYFLPTAPKHLVYMLQQVDYEPTKFIGWLTRLPGLKKIEHRKKLVLTARARLLIFAASTFWLVSIAAGIVIASSSLGLGLFIILASPLLMIGWLLAIVSLAWLLIEKPRRRIYIDEAEKIFAKHPGLKIAILGSYGKTTTKELLLTILGGAKKVAASPLNLNVPISHARWAKTLKGDEDVLVIEYGEGAPGDIAELAKLTHPDIAVVTGIAPNHLDKYKNIEVLKKDLCSIKDYVTSENIYELDKKIDDIKISAVKVNIEGIQFAVKYKNDAPIKLKTSLIGRHLLQPLAVGIDLAKKMGMSDEEIRTTIAKTAPFEHRLQPKIIGGSWVIDDTYNGSIEGFRAGLQLLKELKAQRKIYVTPGLVDQGMENQRVHEEIGHLIAKAQPDITVLMSSSVTKYIKIGLEKSGYKGEIKIETNPLDFYTHLDQFVAAGDVLLMQNDWTDNYA